MKKVLGASGLIGIIVLMLLLAIGPAVVAEMEPEVGPEGEVEAEEAAEDSPSGTATRIDFEFSGDVAKEGLHVVQDVLAIEVASWYAMDGWQDSGWID